MCAVEDGMSAADPAEDGASKDSREELSEALLKESREELARADGKASILFSASGVVISVLLAGAIARKWDPTELGWFQLLWWPGAVLGATAVVAFAVVVWPRVVHDRPKEDLAYFGHVAQYGNPEELDAALQEKAFGPSGVDRTTDQLFTVSTIVDAKYRWIRRGMVFLGVALLICGLAVALDPIFYIALR